MTLWEQNAVSIVHIGPFEVCWLTAERAHRPELQKQALVWFDGQVTDQLRKGKSLTGIGRDLLPQRIAVTSQEERGDSYLLGLTAMSWAEHQVLKNTEQRGRVPTEQRVPVLSVSCLVESADGLFVLAKRSRNVDAGQDLWSVTCAGYTDFPYDPETQVLRELTEEAGIDRQHLAGGVLPVCLFAYPDAAPAWIEATYYARANLTASEILSGAKSAQDNWEGRHAAFDADGLRSLFNSPLHPPAAANIPLTLERLGR